MALDDLNRAVTDVVSFDRGDDRAGGSTAAVFLSEVPLEQYHAAEDRFLGELTEYTKKQFFQVVYESQVDSSTHACTHARTVTQTYTHAHTYTNTHARS